MEKEGELKEAVVDGGCTMQSELVSLGDKRLPSWMLHNRYIYSGFRQTSSSWWDFSKSIFRMHNETLNVWSHLLGFVCFGVILYHTVFYLGWQPDSPMRFDGIVNALAAANEALRERRSELTTAMMASKEMVAEGLITNGTEKLIAALLHSGLFGNPTSTGMKLLPEAYSFDQIYSGMEAHRAAAHTEWQKVKANTAEAAERIKANVETNMETGRQAAEAAWKKVKVSTAEAAECWSDRVETLEAEVEASYRKLTEQLWQFREQQGRAISDTYETATNIIQSLRIQNTTITLRAAEVLESAARSFHGGTGASVVPMMVFVISAMICLGASAACHLYYAMSYGTSLMMSRVDFTGITCLIAGSFFPPIFYGLHGYVFWQRVYIGSVVLMSACIIATVLNEKFAGPEYSNYRTALFVGLGFIGVFPVSHHFAIYGMTEMFTHLLGMAALYLTGTVFYVLKIPERWYPGCFDYVGNSHLWWHIFVLLAALVHYRGSMAAFEMMQGNPDGLCVLNAIDA